jgi:rSAM/selenodomain-associated transferase 1
MRATTLLGVFAKHWTPGTVKTRLAASIGAEAASELHRAFVERIVERFLRAGEVCVLSFWPPEKRAEFAFAERAGWLLWPQSRGDLGARMRRFFEEALFRGAERIVLIGSDSPTAPVEHVQCAFHRLQSEDVVLGPATDGGYYLVGAAGRVPPIFDDIAWSTPQVWNATVERLEKSKIQYGVLPEWYDVDDAGDLDRLEHELAGLAISDVAWRPLWEKVKSARLRVATSARSPEANPPE